jgi:putative ABC transport system ATP-binding protein
MESDIKIIYQLEQIRKDYLVGAVSVMALECVDVQLRRGEFCALQGPSGSGKSTLLNIMGLLETPTSGKLWFDNVDTHLLSETSLTRHRRQSIGFIFQNFNLVSTLSALENVEYPLLLDETRNRSEVRALARAALKDVGLERFEHHRPAQLSGGQRQRVAIARALVKKPLVILADEPTANLDSKTAHQIIELLHQIKEVSKTSLIIATHDEKVAAMADRRIHLRDGRIELSSDISAERAHNVQTRDLDRRIDS